MSEFPHSLLSRIPDWRELLASGPGIALSPVRLPWPLSLAAGLFAFVLGLAAGSFYTATASRVLYFFYGPGRKSPRRLREFFLRPSFCMACGTPLSAVDLLPVLSYLGLGGRCRHCGTHVGAETFLGELFAGILFPLLLWSGLPLESAFAGLLLAGHLYISMATDYAFFRLDHENTAFLFLWALLGALGVSQWNWNDFAPYLLTAAATGGILLGLFFASKMRGMGFGDVLLGTALALYFGFPWTLVLFQTAPLFAILYWVAERRRTGDGQVLIPFGVFLALGAFATMIFRSLWNMM